jgi:hypothetical protein
MKKYLHSIGIIGYGFTQWLLFAKITALAGLEAAGNYSIAQAVSGPVFGFFLFSIRSLWVAGFIDKVNYRSLYLLRIITMIVALIISVGLMQLFKEWSSVIIAVVFAIKFSEGISDIVYAKYERVGEGYIAASLLILKSVGLILLLCFCIYLDVTLDWICVLFILALFVFLLNDIYHGGGFSCVELNFYKKIKWPDKQELSQMIVLSCNSLFISLVGFLPRYALDFYSTRTIVGYYAVLMLPLTIFATSNSCRSVTLSLFSTSIVPPCKRSLDARRKKLAKGWQAETDHYNREAQRYNRNRVLYQRWLYQLDKDTKNCLRQKPACHLKQRKHHVLSDKINYHHHHHRSF